MTLDYDKLITELEEFKRLFKIAFCATALEALIKYGAGAEEWKEYRDTLQEPIE